MGTIKRIVYIPADFFNTGTTSQTFGEFVWCIHIGESECVRIQFNQVFVVVSARKIDKMPHLNGHGQGDRYQHCAYNVLTHDEYSTKHHLVTEAETALNYIDWFES